MKPATPVTSVSRCRSIFGWLSTCLIRPATKAGDILMLQGVIQIEGIAAQPAGLLDQVDLEALVGQRQRRGHAADAAADDQARLVDGKR